MSTGKNGFTLIELLVVSAIVALLLTLLFPVLGKAGEAAAGQKSSSNLKQIGAALFTHAAEHEGEFPIAGGAVPYGRVDPDTKLPSWQEQLKPYIGEDRRIFRTSRSDEQTNQIYSYFLGCQAVMEETKHFGPVRLNRIERPATYILAGEINGQWFARHDADRDNYTQDPAFRLESVRLPGGYLLLLFADGHVDRAREFNPSTMSYTYGGPEAESREQ